MPIWLESSQALGMASALSLRHGVMVRAQAALNCVALRGICRQHGLEPTFYPEGATGSRIYLSSEQMQRLLKRWEAAELASAKFSGGKPQPTPMTIHMFWEDSSKLLAGDRSPRQLQSADLLGLWSALRMGFAVVLWTYSSIDHMFRHSNLKVRKADDLVSLPLALEWLNRGLRIQHLADYVRCRAVQQHGRQTDEGSWVGDLDQIWLRLDAVTPSSSGHVFATMHAKEHTLRGSQGDTLHWKMEWIASPGESPRHFVNSPMAFPARSEVLDSSVNEMLQLFQSHLDLSKLNYTAVVRIVLERIRLSGLLLDVVDPVKFHPLPHFCVRLRVLGPVEEGARSHGILLPSKSDIQMHSCTLSQTFLTWSKGVDFMIFPIHTDSIYAAVLRRLGVARAVGGPLSAISLDMLGQVSTKSSRSPKRRRLTRKSKPAGWWEAMKAGTVATAVEGEQATQAQEGIEEEIVTPPIASRAIVTPPIASRGEVNSPQGIVGVAPAVEDLTRAMSTLRRSQPQSGEVVAAQVLRDIGVKLCPALLDWNDFLPAVAISRSAMCVKHLQLARLSQRTERRLLRRGFGPVLRTRLHMPAVLDVLACSLARWRVLLVHPAFMLVEAKVEEDMFVDALLSIGLALSRGVSADMVGLVRRELRGRHDREDLDPVVALIAQV